MSDTQTYTRVHRPESKPDYPRNASWSTGQNHGSMAYPLLRPSSRRAVSTSLVEVRGLKGVQRDIEGPIEQLLCSTRHLPLKDYDPATYARLRPPSQRSVSTSLVEVLRQNDLNAYKQGPIEQLLSSTTHTPSNEHLLSPPLSTPLHHDKPTGQLKPCMKQTAESITGSLPTRNLDARASTTGQAIRRVKTVDFEQAGLRPEHFAHALRGRVHRDITGIAPTQSKNSTAVNTQKLTLGPPCCPEGGGTAKSAPARPEVTRADARAVSGAAGSMSKAGVWGLRVEQSTPFIPPIVVSPSPRDERTTFYHCDYNYDCSVDEDDSDAFAPAPPNSHRSSAAVSRAPSRPASAPGVRGGVSCCDEMGEVGGREIAQGLDDGQGSNVVAARRLSGMDGMALFGRAHRDSVVLARTRLRSGRG